MSTNNNPVFPRAIRSDGLLIRAFSVPRHRATPARPFFWPTPDAGRRAKGC
jgi:hypothetical protein